MTEQRSTDVIPVKTVDERLPRWLSAGTAVLSALTTVVTLYPNACDDGSSRCTTWVGVTLGREDTLLPVVLAGAIGVGLFVLLRSVSRHVGVWLVALVSSLIVLTIWLVWFPQPLSGQELIDKCQAVGKVPHIDGGGGCMYPPGTKLP